MQRKQNPSLTKDAAAFLEVPNKVDSMNQLEFVGEDGTLGRPNS